MPLGVSEAAQGFGWGLGRVSKDAQKALGRFSERWRGQYPKAVRFVIEDEGEVSRFFKIAERSFWPKIRSTNATKSRFRELRKRTRPMGVFSDRTSMERALSPVFTYENPTQLPHL